MQYLLLLLFAVNFLLFFIFSSDKRLFTLWKNHFSMSTIKIWYFIIRVLEYIYAISYQDGGHTVITTSHDRPWQYFFFFYRWKFLTHFALIKNQEVHFLIKNLFLQNIFFVGIYENTRHKIISDSHVLSVANIMDNTCNIM